MAGAELASEAGELYLYTKIESARFSYFQEAGDMEKSMEIKKVPSEMATNQDAVT